MGIPAAEVTAGRGGGLERLEVGALEKSAVERTTVELAVERHNRSSSFRKSSRKRSRSRSGCSRSRNRCSVFRKCSSGKRCSGIISR